MLHRAKFGQNRLNRGRDITIFRFFFKMAAVRHLGFVMRVWGPPTKRICGLYHCAKFGWNRCSRFENMHVFRFREFGLKTPIHAPKLRVFGVFDPLNWEQCEKFPKKAHPCASPRRLSHEA